MKANQCGAVCVRWTGKRVYDRQCEQRSVQKQRHTGITKHKRHPRRRKLKRLSSIPVGDSTVQNAAAAAAAAMTGAQAEAWAKQTEKRSSASNSAFPAATLQGQVLEPLLASKSASHTLLQQASSTCSEEGARRPDPALTMARKNLT